jgi:hypothetical protein
MQRAAACSFPPPTACEPSAPWQAVARAWHDFEQLWQAVHKVDDLGDEEHEQRLRKVAQNAGHCQRHARKVGERVTHKHLAGWDRQQERGEKASRIA